MSAEILLPLCSPMCVCRCSNCSSRCALTNSALEFIRENAAAFGHWNSLSYLGGAARPLHASTPAACSGAWSTPVRLLLSMPVHIGALKLQSLLAQIPSHLLAHHTQAVCDAINDALGALQRVSGASDSSTACARDHRGPLHQAEPMPRAAAAGTQLIMAGGHDSSWFCPRCWPKLYDSMQNRLPQEAHPQKPHPQYFSDSQAFMSTFRWCMNAPASNAVGGLLLAR